jgi:hypothetical protein
MAPPLAVQATTAQACLRFVGANSVVSQSNTDPLRRGKSDPLGEDDGLCGAVNVDPGASSGDPSDGPNGRRGEMDRQAAGPLAQDGTAVFA